MTCAARPNSGPHAGGDRLLLFTHGVRIDGRNFHNGMAHPLRQHMQGYPLIQGMNGVAMAQALGDTVGTLEMSACFMTATTRRQAVVRDQDHNG
jgi:hypothetical protein